MTTKPKTRKAPPGNGAEPDPVFAAIAEHKVLIRKYIRCRNNSEAARSKAEIKLGKSLQGAALMTAAAEETMLEYNQFSRASKAERIAGMRMARTKPTTTPGAAAMITHTQREIAAADNREDWDDWAMIALKTVSAALVRMEAA